MFRGTFDPERNDVTEKYRNMQDEELKLLVNLTKQCSIDQIKKG
jgi:hypothetical protein